MNPVTVESMAKALQGEIQLRHTHVKAGPRHPSIEDTHGLDTSPVCCVYLVSLELLYLPPVITALYLHCKYTVNTTPVFQLRVIPEP